EPQRRRPPIRLKAHNNIDLWPVQSHRVRVESRTDTNGFSGMDGCQNSRNVHLPPKSTLRPRRLSTWKTIPPGECRLGRDIHGLLPRYPSFVNLVAVTNGTRKSLKPLAASVCAPACAVP